MHIRIVEPGKRVAIDFEGELAAIVRRILADKAKAINIEAILFDWERVILFNPAGTPEYRLGGNHARELREQLGLLFPALLS